MMPRERVETALAHREPDRIPFDLGSTGSTGIATQAAEGIFRARGWDASRLWVGDLKQGLAGLDDEALSELGVDTRGIQRKSGSGWTLEISEDAAGTRSFTDEWGIGWRKTRESRYYDMASHPLADASSAEDLAAHPWPDPVDPVRLEGISERAEVISDGLGCAAVLGSIVVGVFESSWYMRGLEAMFMDMALRPQLAGALLDRLVEIKMAFWDKVLPLVAGKVSVVREGDDLGSQSGLLMSPEMYRDIVKPRHKRLFSFIKERCGGAKLFFHSCGAIRELIPDLIEIGVDILNPVQVSAAGMDTGRLKAEFGSDITFWGGGVDTQKVLPYGTPGEVREEVRRRVGDLAPGGGFVFATVHNIQGDVPLANIEAMLDEFEKLRDY